MNPYNSIQLVGNELVIVADSSVAKNQISVKPDRDIPTRLWGSINGILTYSVPVGNVDKVIVYMRTTDKLWIDSRVTVPVLRFDLAASSSSSSSSSSATNLPKLKIIHPLEHTTVEPFSSTIRAEFDDAKLNSDPVYASGIVEKVDFYANDKLVSTVTAPPWTGVILNLPKGDYSFVAKATFKSAPKTKRAVRVDYFKDGEYLTSVSDHNQWSVPVGTLNDPNQTELRSVTVYEDGSQHEELIVSNKVITAFLSHAPVQLLTPEESFSLGL